MIKFSEYVSIGHPDKVADYISEYLLDKWIEKDSNVRYAVEVQIKDNYVTLGGEVSSSVSFTDAEIEQIVRDAVKDIGYTTSYQAIWGKENVISSKTLEVVNHIGQQSPTIAQGVNGENAGWGDQGIFFGYAVPNEDTCGMPYDYALARRINKWLYDFVMVGLEYGADGADFGIDIKTEVITEILEGSEIVNRVIVAIPSLKGDTSEIEKEIRGIFPETQFADIIINGTGAYVSHSSIADCGTTGRKLAVDFYGGNAKIGGGSPWTKDGSKADLTLNLFARHLAKKAAFAINVPVECSIACCIGRSTIVVSLKNATNNQVINEYTLDIKPQELIKKFKLDTPIYASMCKWGLFGEFQKDKVWEQV